MLDKHRYENRYTLLNRKIHEKPKEFQEVIDRKVIAATISQEEQYNLLEWMREVYSKISKDATDFLPDDLVLHDPQSESQPQTHIECGVCILSQPTADIPVTSEALINLGTTSSIINLPEDLDDKSGSHFGSIPSRDNEISPSRGTTGVLSDDKLHNSELESDSQSATEHNCVLHSQPRKKSRGNSQAHMDPGTASCTIYLPEDPNDKSESDFGTKHSRDNEIILPKSTTGLLSNDENPPLDCESESESQSDSEYNSDPESHLRDKDKVSFKHN
jgi:hypothetical protein